MKKEELAGRYVARLKKCLLLTKIFVICAVAAIAALLVFIAVAASTDMQTSNLSGLVVGVAVPGFVAVAGVIGALSCLVVAKIFLNKLKKLGADEL